MTELSLRGWQSAFLRQLDQHRLDDFLLVACPAAGKTIAGAVGAARLMQRRECNQLVVIAPTVVVRDQWKAELSRLGFRMADSFEDGWPDYLHGVVGTYAQLGHRAVQYAEQIARRRTVVLMDEIHHLGADRSWGDAAQVAFSNAVFRLKTTGTPFRSDEDAIPFVRYDDTGRCVADYGYDYGQAVKEGVCRPIRFQPHNGVITWREDDEDRTMRFSEPADFIARARRLRASLDPSKRYLRSMLEAAHRDLLKMRERVPDAAGLVVADSKQHAREIDNLFEELFGLWPVVAFSDLPRSHEAIRQFACSQDEWLVSVRMVSEGVDIPRLGVIVWATAARTELMVRQVSGRALRGRAEYSRLPAVVHMPADPQLIRFAERLEVLGGISVRTGADRTDHTQSQAGKDKRWKGTGKQFSIDPAPFVKWFDRMADGLGNDEMCRRCGWGQSAGTRRMHRWRNRQGLAPALEVFDACHMAGVSFEELFKGEEYAQARAYVEDPEAYGVDLAVRAGRGFGSVDARPLQTLPAPILPRLVVPHRQLHSEQLVQVLTPELPPTPEMIRKAEYAKRSHRTELARLVNTLMTLRRLVDACPERVQAELVAAVGSVGPESSVAELDRALGWVRDQLAGFAVEHPVAFKEVAARHRRLALAGDRQVERRIA